MTTKVLEAQLRRNIIVYIDDIVIISAARQDHTQDLAETFANLRKANLSLNPKKCVFEVHKGKVLGCLVSTKGMEANLDKITALCNMQEPQSIRDVQKLTGGITTLNRFIPRSADRSLPFFKVLRSSQKFEWGTSKGKCHTKFQKEHQMHHICALGSSFIHMEGVISEYIKDNVQQHK